MYKKLFWGLSILMLLIVTVFVFMTVRNRTEIRQLKEEAAEAEKLSEDRNKHLVQQPDVGNKPPQEAKDGFKWEWHGDHWHEMPVAQTEVPRQTPVNIYEQKRLQRQAEARAEEDKLNAAYAAAKTAREKNQIYMDELKNYPVMIDEYNFYKEHPDFDPDTASPELYAKWRAAVRAKHAKMRAWADEITARHRSMGTPMDQAPKNPKPIIVRPDPPHQEEGGDE